jgi:hypothetical protein
VGYLFVILKTHQRTLKRTLPHLKKKSYFYTCFDLHPGEHNELPSVLFSFSCIEKLDEIGLTVAKKMKICNEGKSKSVIVKKRRFKE